jgi:hypothetical protein
MDLTVVAIDLFGFLDPAGGCVTIADTAAEIADIAGVDLDAHRCLRLFDLRLGDIISVGVIAHGLEAESLFLPAVVAAGAFDIVVKVLPECLHVVRVPGVFYRMGFCSDLLAVLRDKFVVMTAGHVFAIGRQQHLKERVIAEISFARIPDYFFLFSFE